MSKPIRTVIAGASGFAGAELVRRLMRHPGVELIRVCSADHIGAPLSDVHPHLEGHTDLKFSNSDVDTVLADAELLLMGVPVHASFPLARAAIEANVRVIDLSGAHRLSSPAAFANVYGMEHPAPHQLALFEYGLPELNREVIRAARFVALPGLLRHRHHPWPPPSGSTTVATRRY